MYGGYREVYEDPEVYGAGNMRRLGAARNGRELIDRVGRTKGSREWTRMDANLQDAAEYWERQSPRPTPSGLPGFGERDLWLTVCHPASPDPIHLAVDGEPDRR